MPAHEGKGTILTFFGLVLAVVWGLWKHSDDDRREKSKQATRDHKAWCKRHPARAKRQETSYRERERQERRKQGHSEATLWGQPNKRRH